MITIKATYHADRTGDLTGLNFEVELGRGKALVSVQEMPPVSFQDKQAAYRSAIRSLAEALLQEAQNPQGITEIQSPPE